MSSPFDTGGFARVTGLDQVATHADAAGIVKQMLAHPTQWENPTLERFLDALAACLNTLPAGYANGGEYMPDQPTWTLLAETIVAASGYE